MTANLQNEEEVKAGFRQAVEKFGRIDYAVNNAAIASPFKGTHESETGDFDRVVGINLRGLWFCQREELRIMMGQEALPASLCVFTSFHPLS